MTHSKFCIAVSLIILANIPAQADQLEAWNDGVFHSAKNMQIARADKPASTSQRRTHDLAGLSTQATSEQPKQESQNQPAVHGPAGKFPGEMGAAGKNKFEHSDNFRLPGDVADGCSKHLRCSGD
ncbi:MAG: hypothetical protein WCD07_06775 [Burkholderiales bacterium]